MTVLDLIYHHFPETFPRASRLGLRALVPAGARRADRVIAISDATASATSWRRSASTPTKVDAVHLGFGMSQAPDPVPEAELRERYGLGDDPIVLTISAALRHKNLDRLIAAFARVASDRDVRLVAVGHGGLEQDALRAAARAQGVGDRVVFTGWVDDEVVEGLYAAATVFAYPSLLEGFGLPILEAMRRDVPVACSNLSALPEVAGDAAELFDPHDVDAIAAAISAPARRRRAARGAGRARTAQVARVHVGARRERDARRLSPRARGAQHARAPPPSRASSIAFSGLRGRGATEIGRRQPRREHGRELPRRHLSRGLDVPALAQQARQRAQRVRVCPCLLRRPAAGQRHGQRAASSVASSAGASSASSAPGYVRMIVAHRFRSSIRHLAGPLWNS